MKKTCSLLVIVLKDDKEVGISINKKFALYKNISSNLKKDKVFLKKVLKTILKKNNFQVYHLMILMKVYEMIKKLLLIFLMV